MACKRCTSDSQGTFGGELAIHFPRLEGLSKSMVFVFPKLLVCLECGFAELTVPEKELSVLATGEAVVLDMASHPRGTPPRECAPRAA
jgi:hypothetical protein